MKIRSYCYSAILFIVLLPATSFIASADSLKKLQDEVIEKQLWHSSEWINLLHYYSDSWSKSGYLSQVDDPRFFNAVDGVKNPRSEMLATVAAFYRNDVSDNEHPICLFPARLQWLSEHIAIEELALPNVECTDYFEWREIVQAQQVTLIFPTYHLNSPSSMFGHTLLRLDRTLGENNSKWLSFAVNFGANINAADNSLLYAVRGLTGGYPGIFIVTPYYNKIKEYNRIEKRDIWEYRLNLTLPEVERMIVHLWELKEVNFDYYFFDENCSYRLLELLEVARPGLELTEQFDVTAIPIDTVKAIDAAGLIEDVTFRPSKVTELEALLGQLSLPELDYFEQLVIDVAVAESAGFMTLPIARQKKIIDAAYRYQRYQQNDKTRDDVLAKQSYILLRLLNEYPSDNTFLPIAKPIQPEKGHDSRRLLLTVGKRDEQRYQALSLRMAFHSLEESGYGYLRGAHINMANMAFQFNNKANEVRLQRLDLIDIFSLTPRSRFFKPISWRVYTGLERQMTSGEDRLVSHVTFGGGVSYEVMDEGVFYTLATGRLEYNPYFSGDRLKPALGVASGLLWHFGSMISRIELAGEKFSDGNYRSRLLLRHNIPLSRNHALHFSATVEEHTIDQFSDLSVAYRYHF